MKFTGLTDKEVLKSREKEGANVIPDSEPATFWDEFKETFNDPMIRILLAIVVIMLVMFFLGHAEIYEPIGTVIAVLIVAFVTAKTAVASDTKYRELKGSTKKETCKVYRNGIITVIEVDDVVVGDKIILQAGDKIPADGILIDGDLRVDNSVLNGEAEECKKFAAAVETEFPEKLTGETFVDDYSLFRGAVVFDGEGILDVRKVGIKTMMGKMAEDMQDEEPDSPLKVKLSKLAKQISIFGYASAVIIVILYMAYFIIKAGGFSGYVATGWSNILMNTIEAVSLAILIVVCAVPEGLPLMISLVLMQNTSKMLDHNVLVRKAVGVETAGSLNILFSDKTGTITKGSLEVVEFFTPDGVSIPLDEMKKHKFECPHYSISIIRDRGIDRNAIEFILKKHRAESIQFVDGWTGKGAIYKELRKEISFFEGVSDELAVLADPAFLTNLCGTHEDIMIPSSCLNCTVSGLLSRTFLRNDIIKENDFHGAAFYKDLILEDRTYEFIDYIEKKFQYNLKPKPDEQGNLGIEEVERISEIYRIENINYIKPGIGETTRVLLRRVPWKVLIDSRFKDSRELEHIVQLVREKSVDVEYMHLNNYKCCGLIKQFSDI